MVEKKVTKVVSADKVISAIVLISSDANCGSILRLKLSASLSSPVLRVYVGSALSKLLKTMT